LEGQSLKQPKQQQGNQLYFQCPCPRFYRNDDDNSTKSKQNPIILTLSL
jgi:hypothetical protein